MPRRCRPWLSAAEDTSQTPPARRRRKASESQDQGDVQSSGPLDALHVDRVIQILRLLPVKHVFVLMSVNKKWEAAARQVIRMQEALEVCYSDYDEFKVSPLDRIVCRRRHWNRNNRRWKSLMQSLAGVAGDRKKTGMRSLKWLVCDVYKRYTMCPTPDQFERLVINNAESLEVLVTGCCVPVGDNISYPRLKRLDCKLLDTEPEYTGITPSIRHQCDSCALHKLNVSKMRHLRLQIQHSFTEDQDVHLMLAVKHLTRLKALHLLFDHKIENDSPLLSLFDDFSGLEDVQLRIRNENLNMDAVVAKLAHHNSCLKRVNFCGFGLTDESLLSLSRLKHLSSVCLNSTDLTVAGLINFLRGRSRHVLEKFEFDSWTTNVSLFSSEIDAMRTESGNDIEIRVLSPGYGFVVGRLLIVNESRNSAGK